MREILFRGKTSNGEWEYGVPVFSGLNNELAFMKQMHSYDHQVIPETVGQYTGLTDKNGTKIFEGDILQQYKDVWLKGHRTGELRELCKFVVEYDEPYAGFSPCYSRGDDREKYDFNEDYCVVIGNVHDNPELLGGKQWNANNI